jgi:hypothetical protein
MSKRDLYVRALAVVTALAGASGCRVIGDVFKAGIWAGVLVIALVVVFVVGLARHFARR